MKQNSYYSDSDDFNISGNLPQEQSKTIKAIHESTAHQKDIFSSENLLKDSGIAGIPLQKHKYANKIKTISTQITSKDLAQKIQTTLTKKQSHPSASLIREVSVNQDDGTSSLNYPQNNKSTSALDKKQRNKQSAKQSRDRKKLYIEMLEQKQKSLTKKLLSRKKQLQETKNYLDRVINQNKAMSGFTASRHQLIKNLQSVLQNKELLLEEKNKEINNIIDNLRYKIGAAGKQRINTINEYFRQIVNLSLPALHRYMMWSATEENHLFSQNQEQETDDWYKQLKQSLNLTEEQKKEVQSKKAFLQEQKKVLEKLIGKLKSIKTQIEEKSIELQDLIDQIRSILTPIQCANFILFIEKNKYRKELNLCDQLEPDSKEKIKISDTDDSGPRKIVKIDQTQ